MSPEDDGLQRLAAESLAADTGMSIEQALEALAFQDRVMEASDDLDGALGEASGDFWFDWSDGRGRLKIGIATWAEAATIDAVRRVLNAAGVEARTDLVRVVWTTAELEAAQERASDLLESLSGAWSTAREPDTNSIWIGVPEGLTSDQVKVVEAAVRAAGVSARVETGLDWGVAVPLIATPRV